jgi:hypothetical protein
MKIKTLLLISSIATITGCAGKLDYAQPTEYGPTENSIVIAKSRSEVWNTAVPQLGKKFFVINNLDKSSGLINVSYSGDPENYVDCGHVTSYVKNARGERTYSFPAAKAHQNYEVMNANGLFQISREMKLEGRVNLIFEEISKNSTRVTANTKYVLERSINARNLANNFPITDHKSISFNTGNSALFPAGNDGRATKCISTGSLETDILNAIN